MSGVRASRSCVWGIGLNAYRREMNLVASSGVAIGEFPLTAGHGNADNPLFADRRGVGMLETKPLAITLSGVEPQSGMYA